MWRQMRAWRKLWGQDTEQGAKTVAETGGNCSRGPNHPQFVLEAPSSHLPYSAGSPQEPGQVNTHPLLLGWWASRGPRQWEPSLQPACTGPQRPRMLTTTGFAWPVQRMFTISSKSLRPRKPGAFRGWTPALLETKKWARPTARSTWELCQNPDEGSKPFSMKSTSLTIKSY